MQSGFRMEWQGHRACDVSARVPAGGTGGVLKSSRCAAERGADGAGAPPLPKRSVPRIDLNRRTAIIENMDSKSISEFIARLTAAIEKRLPEYLADEADRSRNEGNSALCIIDEQGVVHGKMFGRDKLRTRHSFRVAWTKASQVWITGIKTGEYEKLVFTGQID